MRHVAFLTNLLYISLSTNVLQLYACTQISDTVAVMTLDPTVTCYEGEHVTALVLSIIPLLVYVVGFPVCLGMVFYTGSVKVWLEHPTYMTVFGFLYKRYESNYFWWHLLILLYKLAFGIENALSTGIVTLQPCIGIFKTFMLQEFGQGPGGLILVFGFTMAQCYARPFESTKLDRLMTFVQLVLAIEICIGILYCTERGSTDMQNTLTNILFVSIFALTVAIACVLAMDVIRYRKLGKMRAIAEGELNIYAHTKLWICCQSTTCQVSTPNHTLYRYFSHL